jgi:hypothetical protein
VPTPRVPDREHNEPADQIAEDDRGRLGALGLNNQIDGAAQYAASLLGPAQKSNLFRLLRCTRHFRFGSSTAATRNGWRGRYTPNTGHEGGRSARPLRARSDVAIETKEAVN